MNDQQAYFVHEFVDDYKSGLMSRRDMMRRLLYITGGIASTATLLLELGCSPRTPAAATAVKPAASPGVSPSPSPPARSPLSVPASDPSLDAQDVAFPGNGATLIAYQVRPKSATGPLPVILVCHRNQGLEEHIRDVARRWAKAGYVACALDLLSREGGTAKVDPAQIPAVLSAADINRHAGDFQAAAGHYATQPFAQPDRLGMSGFCFGGSVTWRSVELIPTLKAAVPFYGGAPPLDQVPNVKAAILGIYSSDPNDFANRGRDQLDAALTSAKVTHQFNVYPDTRHDFYNDTGGAYNAEQAMGAWRDAMAWFQHSLKA